MINKKSQNLSKKEFNVDMSIINNDFTPEIQLVEKHLNKLSPENRKKFLELFKTERKK